MNSDFRKKLLYEMLQKQEYMQVSEIAAFFGVSQMTVRRDMDELVKAQLIERSYGKAHIKTHQFTESSFDFRVKEHPLIKHRLAQTALEFIKDQDSIFIDGSTTCNEIIKILPKNKRLTVYTNSIATLQILRQMNWINTFAIGGFLSSDMTTLDGDMAIKTAKSLYVDVTFLSCWGFSKEGVVNNTIEGYKVRKIVLNNSQKTFLLADHSKFNIEGMFLYATWDKFNTLITDKQLPKIDLNHIENLGVKVVICK